MMTKLKKKTLKSKKKDKTQCYLRGLEMKSTNLLGFF